MSEIKVNSIKGVSASTAAITISNTDGTCTANLTNRTNKNLVINGAFLINQRGSSSTSAGFQTVDRFQVSHFGVAASPTQSQVDVASGTTPYTLGFRKAYKITNANQGGVHNDALIRFLYQFEAQDIANSGWTYLSSSSNITLSFWIKSSVSQNFFGRLNTIDGTSQNYPFETGSLSADTWTKVTKTIPGNSNLQFDNNNDEGLVLEIVAWYGTDLTGSVSLNQWATQVSATRTPDNTSTWYTTNNATLEITGVQLEVGSVATDFEHRSYGQELNLCRRYFQMSFTDNPSTTNTSPDGLYFFGGGRTGDSTSFLGAAMVQFSPPMRATPTVTIFDHASPRNTGKCHRHTYGFAGQNNQPVSVTDSNIHNMAVRSDSGHNANGIIFHFTAEAEL